MPATGVGASRLCAEGVSVPERYELREGPPSVADYLALRAATGFSPRRRDQAVAALAGSWGAFHVVARESSQVAVGMGRLLGDGGWYFHLADIAVLPEHQRRGLGDAIVSALLGKLQREAPPGAYVTLLADPPGRGLYSRHGFLPTAPRSVGMALVLGAQAPA